MSENCTHDCSSCGENCSSRTQEQTSFLEALHPLSSVKKVIGVVSGKGGVGKSLVTSLMAVKMNSKGYRTAILDADITGPSIPRMYGTHGPAQADEEGIDPVYTKNGIALMSINLLLPDEGAPVIWRGPILANMVKQFWSDVRWGELDYLLVDMPPGTGDVPLTVFQSLPVDAVVIVTSPQELVSMIVSNAVHMAKKMDIPILGVVENMSYLECPDCGKKISVFGESRIDEEAEAHGIPVLARIPIDPKTAAMVDEGAAEYLEGDWLDGAAEKLARMSAGV